MKPLPWIRKAAVLVIGATLLGIGAALLFLPGPGTVVGGIGLAVLATEFWWARWAIKRARRYGEAIAQAARNGMGLPPVSKDPARPKTKAPARE